MIQQSRKLLIIFLKNEGITCNAGNEKDAI